MQHEHIVTAKWLAEHCSEPNLVILYTAMADPVSGETPVPPGFIPGSVLFDFETNICDSDSTLPHTMPGGEVFTRKVRELGINQQSRIVVYDAKGIYSSARVWWMFKAMGHNNIAVLNGGVPGWLAEGFRLEAELQEITGKGDFNAEPQHQLLFNLAQVASAIEDKGMQVVDARAQGRFCGTAAEPRTGLRSGHIPGSVNLPFGQCLNQAGFIKPRQELNKVFTQHHVDESKHLVFSCGSGVTACILALAADILGIQHWAVYDGSWSEWGASNMPVATQRQ